MVKMSDPELLALMLRTRLELLTYLTSCTGIPLERRVSLRDPIGLPLAVTLTWNEMLALVELQL